jgi:hypothetical protein
MVAETFTIFVTKLLTRARFTHANTYEEKRNSLYIYIKRAFTEILRHVA